MMIRAIKNIFKGLVRFFRGVITLVAFVPRAFSTMWGFFHTLKSLTSVMPAGLAALGVLALVCAVILLVLGR